MKQLIAKLPMLTAPMEKEELIVYLAASKETVSAVLMTEREAKQTPIYFVSRALRGPKLNYTSMEKLVLALVHASKRLKRFDATNNEAEYEALIAGLKIAEQIASTSFAHLSKQVLVEELKEKSISEVEVLAVVEEEGDTWMTPIFKYLAEETLPTNMKKAMAIRRKSWRFAVINRILYKKSFLGPWLRCVGPLQANYVLREIHERSCSMHAGTLSVVAKALWTGYYWPTMHKDARTLIRACQDCQVHKPVPRNLQQKLTPITSSWPFYKWGIDIAGPFSEGPVKVKFLIVAMEYFTKWIKAKPVATITGNQIKKSVWDNIVCRFGLHGEIISDNGKQFRDDPFKDWCEKLCINQHFASVKHPQTNGLVERTNHSLGEGIKARLEAKIKNWIEELPHVLWVHRTMIKSSNGDTPFSLTYGTEAVIPAEIGMPTIRTAKVDLVQNNEALEINLDLLEERREEAAIREAKSKAKIVNDQFAWPQEWLSKYPSLLSVNVPNLSVGVPYSLVWKNGFGIVKQFSVQTVWNDIRPRGVKVDWYSTVWFSACIPRHALNLWQIVRRRLKTQDKLRAWDHVDWSNLTCSLCELQPDSHEHLFFDCVFSQQVWSRFLCD
ncbi:reverse transcriptase domain-containing protein [Tanacetum coccineum]